MLELAVPEIVDVNIASQPNVVSKVPAHVIGVFIDHNLIGIPKPVVTKPHIVRGNAKVVTAEPEASRTAARQPPNMPSPESASKVPMLPGMIEMVVHVVPAGVMTDPLAVRMHVRSVWVPSLVSEVSMLLASMWRASNGCRTVGRNMATADTASALRVPASPFLRYRRNTEQ